MWPCSIKVSCFRGRASVPVAGLPLQVGPHTRTPPLRGDENVITGTSKEVSWKRLDEFRRILGERRQMPEKTVRPCAITLFHPLFHSTNRGYSFLKCMFGRVWKHSSSSSNHALIAPSGSPASTSAGSVRQRRQGRSLERAHGAHGTHSPHGSVDIDSPVLCEEVMAEVLTRRRCEDHPL